MNFNKQKVRLLLLFYSKSINALHKLFTKWVFQNTALINCDSIFKRTILDN